MDPHQDIVSLTIHYYSTKPNDVSLSQWSRFSGGSGAPYWTLPACGINPRNFTATQSAILHCEYPLAHDPDPGSLPAMIWSTNYGRLASQTIFTLFFAGNDYAPKCIIDGKNIQDYLQEHYIEAMGQMADRIREAGDLLEECVIGWDSMNEPFEGWCGWPDLNATPDKQGSTLKKGTYPTPAQSLRLGMGQPQTVDNWQFGTFGPSRDGSVTIDPKGYKMWADPDTETGDGVHPKWGWRRDKGWVLGECIWAQHGVWDIETGYIMRPDYFKCIPDSEEVVPVEFIDDYWKPHWQAFTKRIRHSHPEAIMFIQPPVFAPPPQIEPEDIKGRCAYSGHYYDGLTLVTRHWNWFNADALGLLRGKYSTPLQAVKIGETAIRKSLQEQLGMLKEDTSILGPYPTIIGEIGTPFDMDSKRSYGWTDNGKYKGDYSRQESALDASLNGADGGNALNWTVWTYCPDHSHDWGDGWNMEDLSLWSPDDVGGREEMEGFYRMGDESRAGLLPTKKKEGGCGGSNMKMITAAAASSLSLASFGLGAGAIFQELRAQKSEAEYAGWHDNPYMFLTDGARAVRAFSRPWPTKVIGKSVDMKFDLKKAEFTLVVGVKAEDQPRRAGLGLGDEDEELATEIYVPLIHFANDRLLDGQSISPSSSAQTDTTCSTSSGGVGHIITSGHAESDGKGSPIEFQNPSTINLAELHIEPQSLSKSFHSHSTGSTAVAPDLREQDKDLVDIGVKVSSGRWSVEGQTLKWWYDVPKEGEPSVEYTIEIRRRGGVIAIKDVEEGGWCPSKSGGCQIM